jgi:hypothetical protein
MVVIDGQSVPLGSNIASACLSGHSDHSALICSALGGHSKIYPKVTEFSKILSMFDNQSNF